MTRAQTGRHPGHGHMPQPGSAPGDSPPDDPGQRPPSPRAGASLWYLGNPACHHHVPSRGELGVPGQKGMPQAGLCRGGHMSRGRGLGSPTRPPLAPGRPSRPPSAPGSPAHPPSAPGSPSRPAFSPGEPTSALSVLPSGSALRVPDAVLLVRACPCLCVWGRFPAGEVLGPRRYRVLQVPGASAAAGYVAPVRRASVSHSSCFCETKTSVSLRYVVGPRAFVTESSAFRVTSCVRSAPRSRRVVCHSAGPAPGQARGCVYLGGRSAA